VHAEEAEHLGEDAGVRRCLDEANTQPADLTTSSAFGSALCAGCLRERQSSFGEKRAAGRGEGNTSRHTLEQWRPELALAVGDRPTKWRVRVVLRLGGAAEVQLFGDGDEVAEVAELHRS
jgi:hypothetical protein